MGNQYFDQYTYLHFAVGIIVYFWNISLVNLVILHTIFEFLENSQVGVNIINKYIVVWPGGIGDTLGAILGWLSAYYLDKLGNNFGWYTLHIK
jgi:hypothetical protein